MLWVQEKSCWLISTEQAQKCWKTEKMCPGLLYHYEFSWEENAKNSSELHTNSKNHATKITRLLTIMP